jgi:hypothetical protein
MEARRKIREDYGPRTDIDARIVKALLLDADYDEREASNAKFLVAQARRSEDAAKKKLDDYTFAIEKGDAVPMAMHRDKMAAAAADVKRWRDIAQAAEEALRQGGIKRT